MTAEALPLVVELRRGEEFRAGGDGVRYVVAYLVLNGELLASGFHVPVDRYEELAAAVGRSAAVPVGPAAPPPDRTWAQIADRHARALRSASGALEDAFHYGVDLGRASAAAAERAKVRAELLAMAADEDSGGTLGVPEYNGPLGDVIRSLADRIAPEHPKE